MKILVLGHKGMLGNAVYKYMSTHNFFTKTTYKVEHINERWPSPEFKEKVREFDGEFIINCIGAIPQKTDDFVINYDLPIWLDKNVNSKVIHPGTDCEMDEDHYGISKINASDYIKNDGERTTIIKTSIIGHELKSNNSLLDWFLNEESVYGFTNAMWNGITTLEWAKFCEVMITDDGLDATENILHSRCISKYDLLLEINKAYDKQIEVKPNDKDMPNKCLIGGWDVKPIYEQLKELREFYDN